MSGSFPWPDLLVIIVVIGSAWAATRRGFLAVLLSLLGFILSLVVAFSLYPAVALWLTGRFQWPEVWSKPLAFVGLWVLVEGVFGLLEAFVVTRFLYGLNNSPTSKALALLPGAAQGLVASAVLLTILALVPIGGNWRNDVFNSALGSRLVGATLTIERPLEGVFGPAAHEALGFLTVKPPTGSGDAHEEAVKLNFTVQDAAAEPDTEDAMLALVNQERTSRGLAALQMDPELRLLARAHADDMFKRGYFSHETPEGVDPFQRMTQANIAFGLAGENLALAPTLDIAHQGLMNSPGHRANILRDGFLKVGIGVLNGGLYGKMFVQEFTD